MKRLYFTVTLLLAGLAVYAKDDATNTVPSFLKNVIVYRSGAEMTHTTTAVLKQGDNEVIVDNLSNQVDVNSIQVKAPAAVSILGVEFSGNYLVPSEKTAREKMLQDSLGNVQDEIDKIQLNITNTADLLDVLKDNRSIKGEQAGLTVAELAKLMDYYKTESLELQTTLQQLNSRKKKLGDLAAKIKSQVDEEQKKNISTAGRLTLRLSAAMAGRYDFTISYIAKNAYWTPYYDVRVDDISKPLQLTYKAKIVQTTGIDWKQVKLSLSTSTPSSHNNAPELNTWFLGYLNTNNNIGQYLQGKVSGVSTLNDVVVVGYTATGRDKDNDVQPEPRTVYIVNGSFITEEEFHSINPNTIKSMKVLKSKEAEAIYGSRASAGAVVVDLKNGLEDYVSVTDSLMDMVFDIDIPYNVPTNGKEQVAMLKVQSINAVYRHVTIPKLDPGAYLIGEITDFEKLNLLPGEANIMMEGTYVGKTFINPALAGDTLRLTLGKDERIAVKRNKVQDYSSVKFLGSNKLQKFEYEIVLKNNKKQVINLDIKDQFPVSTNKDIDVTLIESNGAQVDYETGALNYHFTLAPGESKKLQFVYSIKYPKDKTLNLN
ncbi:MAG TPA: DUF4139 domain-containing protein [Chitinophagaceae bacterium]|nr:DUF4139 domain-containing protein [Chitinophagaceae bacterium]